MQVKMFRDIVIPQDNEMEFIEVASRLGIKKLYFMYQFDEYNEKRIQEKLSSVRNDSNITLQVGFIVSQNNINAAFAKSKIIVVKSSDKDKIFIENSQVKIIFGFEELQKKDYLLQRASGLNHVMCELARKNNISIGLSYSSLLHKNNHTTALIIGRMMQNIKLCRKYKIDTVIGAFSETPLDLRAPNDLISLFIILGMSGKNIKESLIGEI